MNEYRIARNCASVFRLLMLAALVIGFGMMSGCDGGATQVSKETVMKANSVHEIRAYLDANLDHVSKITRLPNGEFDSVPPPEIKPALDAIRAGQPS